MHLKCGKCYKEKLVTNTYECSHTTPLKGSVCVCLCVTCHIPSVDLVSIIFTKPVVSPECGQVYVNSV